MSLLKEDKVAPELGMGGKNSKTQRRFYKSPSTKSSVGGGGGMGADLDHTRGAPFMPAGNNAFLTQEINNSSTKKILKNKRQSVNPSLPSLPAFPGHWLRSRPQRQPKFHPKREKPAKTDPEHPINSKHR